jgi:hypothetical protein
MTRNSLSDQNIFPRARRRGVALLAGLLTFLGSFLASTPSARATGLLAFTILQPANTATFLSANTAGTYVMTGQMVRGNFQGTMFLFLNREVNVNVFSGIWIMPVFSGGQYVGTVSGLVTAGGILEPGLNVAPVTPIANMSLTLFMTQGTGRFAGTVGFGFASGFAGVDNHLAGMTGGAFPYQFAGMFLTVALTVFDNTQFLF